MRARAKGMSNETGRNVERFSLELLTAVDRLRVLPENRFSTIFRRGERRARRGRPNKASGVREVSGEKRHVRRKRRACGMGT